MSITTGYGDEGATRLLTGERVWKDDQRIEALGDIDELICLLGEARARIAEREHAGMILDMQRAVMRVATEVASTADDTASGQDTINAEDIAVIETRQKQLETESGELPSGFILPGGSPGGAALDHSRAVARRVERRLVSLFGPANRFRNTRFHEPALGYALDPCAPGGTVVNSCRLIWGALVAGKA